MGTKFAVIDEDENLPAPVAEPEKQGSDLPDLLNRVLTIGALILGVGVLCTCSYFTGAYMSQPTFVAVKGLIEDEIGEDAAESYVESTSICPDGKKFTKACRLLVKYGMRPAPRIAAAKVQVPKE